LDGALLNVNVDGINSFKISSFLVINSFTLLCWWEGIGGYQKFWLSTDYNILFHQIRSKAEMCLIKGCSSVGVL
jgi:hypothetical protein